MKTSLQHENRRRSSADNSGEFSRGFLVRDIGPNGKPAFQEGPAARYLLLLLSIWLLQLPASAAALRAGAATASITPPLGIEINGGTHPAIATHVHDELHARALVLDDGNTRLAFVVVDNCLLPRELCDQAKRLIQESTQLSPDRVCISATHTHSAGSVASVHLAEADASYAAWLPGQLSDAVRIAINRLAPAEVGWSSGSVPQHVFCRRVLVKPGVTYTNLLGEPGDRVKMNWSSPEPGVDHGFSGPTDPELFVLAVRHVDGRPLALLASYSLHYVGGVGGGHLSADYFGVFASRIGELLEAGNQDPPFVGILCNGTSGDINNNDFRQARPPQPPYAQIRRVAEDCAQEALRVTRSLGYRSDVTLRAAARELDLAVRRPTPSQLQRAREIIHGRDRTQLKTWTEILARDQILLADYPSRVSVPLQVFRISEVAIAQWPGEIFAVSGLDLKRRTPAKPLFNISLANGWFGYIPPPEQHALGAYETWPLRTSMLETNAIPRITGALLELLEQTK